MKVLMVNQSEVQQLLPMDECMDVMADTLKTLSEGNAILPLRPVMWLPEKVGALGMMPSYLGSIGMMGLKVVSVFPGNHGTEYDSHIGAVMLYETKHGQLLAIVDASEITAIRTAAVSGVATCTLAREDAGDLTIMGAGIQAKSHLAAMREARKIKRVRVWSRNGDHAKAFAERESKRYDIKIEAIADVQQAIEAPRWSTRSFPASPFPHTMYPGDLSIESRISDTVKSALAAKGHKFPQRPSGPWSMGSLAGIIVDGKTGFVNAGADPRVDAYAWAR